MDEGTLEPQNVAAAVPEASPDNAPVPHSSDAVQSLRQAMRRARADDAERSSVLCDLRSARIARLELLQEALRPLVAQIPEDVDYFDIALSPGVNPRVFIDMIGFIEMGRDARVYRFIQDTRHGRTTIKESADIDAMVDAVTDYVARRLLERDKALAADRSETQAEQAPPAGLRRSGEQASRLTPEPHVGDHRPRRAGFLRWAGILFAFVIDLLGSIAFFTLIAALVWTVWNSLHGKV